MPKIRAFAPGRTTYCCYCKRGPLIQGEKGGRNSPLTATRDHIHAQTDGGGRWVPCCQTCNGLKGSLRIGAWLAFVDHNPGYWRHHRSNATVTRWLVEYNRVRRASGRPSLVLYTCATPDFVAKVNNAW